MRRKRRMRRMRTVQTKFFFRKLMRPLVEESWEVTSESSFSSGSIFFASCFPSSTLPAETERYLVFNVGHLHRQHTVYI